MCLQLLLVLSIPALALGLPLVLGHPIIFIVMPFVVYKTPALNSLVEPLLTPVLQSILSGLRPSGSPRSEGFPWQQQVRHSLICVLLATCVSMAAKLSLFLCTTCWPDMMASHSQTKVDTCLLMLVTQTRQSSWSSSPPIDIEYRSLPADSTTDQYSQTGTPTATPSASQTQAPSATESERYTTYEQPSTSYASSQAYTPN